MKRAEAGATQAWQPLTPPGVAAFANASPGRLTRVLVVFAALAGIAVTTFLKIAWFPTIAEATRNLPEVGHIRGGQLAWASTSPALLAESHWLALRVDLHHQQNFRLPSHLQVEFSHDSIRFLSWAGHVDVPYPRGWIIVFNEPELGAWWDAWEPFLAAGAGLLTAMGLTTLWVVLASIYAIAATPVCRFVERGIPYGAVWKICCAAQMPGCLLMSFTLLLYSVRAIDHVQWLFVAAAHLVVGWIYILLTPFFLASQTSQSNHRTNPFRT
jgi:hypothetical protein